MTAIPTRPDATPRNYPADPPPYPDSIFRLEVEAARRYLFETELKELLEEAQIPDEAMNPGGDPFALSVAQVAVFNQGLRSISGDDRAIAYGREAFQKATAIIARG